METQEPTSPWKNFTEQGWDGKQIIPGFLMTPSSASPAVPPEDRYRLPCTAPWGSGGAGDGARLGRGPWTGFKVQGQTGTGTGCSRDTGVWPGTADGLDEPQPEVDVRVVPGSAGHLHPRSVFWEGVRMQAGDAQAQGLRQPHISRLAFSRCLQPGLPGVTAQEFAESLFGVSGPAVPSGAGASPVLRLPEEGGRRCWRCANTAGTGLGEAAAKSDNLEICWHGRSAT